MNALYKDNPTWGHRSHLTALLPLTVQPLILCMTSATPPVPDVPLPWARVDLDLVCWWRTSWPSGDTASLAHRDLVWLHVWPQPSLIFVAANIFLTTRPVLLKISHYTLPLFINIWWSLGPQFLPSHWNRITIIHKCIWHLISVLNLTLQLTIRIKSFQLPSYQFPTRPSFRKKILTHQVLSWLNGLHQGHVRVHRRFSPTVFDSIAKGLFAVAQPKFYQGSGQ